MTIEEYRKGIKAQDDEINAITVKRNDFKKEYAKSNNLVKIGDFVGDRLEFIRVKEIIPYWWLDTIPECVYRGIKHNKKTLLPYKAGNTARVLQSSVIKHIIVNKPSSEIRKNWPGGKALKYKPNPYVKLKKENKMGENDTTAGINNVKKTMDGSGKKDDLGKLRFDLVPPGALKELVAVYNYGVEGAGKEGKGHPVRNWEKGMSWGRAFAALMRHLWDFWGGEEFDKESGLRHLAHAAFWCLTLIEYSRHYPYGDDRSRLRGIDDTEDKDEI